MKTMLFLISLTANVLASTPILVQVTAETLTSLQSRDPMICLVKPGEGAPEPTRPVNQSIINDSTILHDGQNWTIVPKGAVIFLPECAKSRVNARPVGSLLPWSDFLIKNRGWVATNEVSFEQAAGSEELPAERVEHWSKQDKVIIAVHQTGPISVKVSDKSKPITTP